jgi:hypothetical protein
MLTTVDPDDQDGSAALDPRGGPCLRVPWVLSFRRSPAADNEVTGDPPVLWPSALADRGRSAAKRERPSVGSHAQRAFAWRSGSLSWRRYRNGLSYGTQPTGTRSELRGSERRAWDSNPQDLAVNGFQGRACRSQSIIYHLGPAWSVHRKLSRSTVQPNSSRSISARECQQNVKTDER